MNFNLENDRIITKFTINSFLLKADDFNDKTPKVELRNWHNEVRDFLVEYFSDNEVAEFFENEASLTFSSIFYSGMSDEDTIASFNTPKARKALRLILKNIGVVESQATEVKTSKTESRKIFIVHGHDEKRLLEVKEVLNTQVLKPVILKDEPNGGKTIIDKFEANSDVGFAVVLLTSDDFGYQKSESENVKSRARQNVILELGYFIGKLGRSRVCALTEPSVEIPSDFHGVLYTTLDNSGAWKYKLLDELKFAGYSIDKNKL